MRFEELKNKLVGPIFTVYTGFDEALNIDFPTIKKHIDFMAERGAKVHYVMPYNSRYSQLYEREIFELNLKCIEYIKRHEGCIAIVSDCIHGPTSLSVEMGLAAKEAGADIFASIVREKFFSIDQVFDHYNMLSDRLNMPMLVHEMPFLSGFNSKNMTWPIELFRKLQDIENIIAVKEDTKDVEYAIEALELEPRFRLIFAGRKSYFSQLRNHGIQAYLNSISMIEPQYGFDYWDLMQKGTDDALNAFLDEYDNPFWDGLVKKYGWHRVNKATLDVAGHMCRRERSPLKELSDEELKDIREWHEEFTAKRKAVSS